MIDQEGPYSSPSARAQFVNAVTGLRPWRDAFRSLLAMLAAECLIKLVMGGTAMPAAKVRVALHLLQGVGGRGEIRTPEPLAGLPVFKTGAFNRSATLPSLGLTYFA